MSNIFNGFLDNLVTGTLNPKGNFGDYSHASRTFVKNQFRLAPKVKFLYHVYFEFNPNTIDKILPTWKDRHTLESGLMVKTVTLPTFTVNVETKKKYNRTKQIQTGITYEPCNMTFHDDNLGVMTGLLEAYFRYYYADGYGEIDSIKSSYQKNSVSAAQPGTGFYGQYSQTNQAKGDNTYKGASRNNTIHGLNTKSVDPFFRSIHINQMSRHTFTKFKIVNPMISSWGYGDMAYGTTSETNELNVTFNYETVWIERGATEAGRGITGTSPTGFGDLAHYDVTPSPLNIMGGGSVSLTSTITAAADIISSFTGGDSNRGQADLFDYKQSGKGFTTLGAIIGGINIFKNAGKITQAGVEEEIVGLIGAGAAGLQDNIVSGVGGFGGADE